MEGCAGCKSPVESSFGHPDSCRPYHLRSLQRGWHWRTYTGRRCGCTAWLDTSPKPSLVRGHAGASRSAIAEHRTNLLVRRSPAPFDGWPSHASSSCPQGTAGPRPLGTLLALICLY
eukprot:6570371-Heterocapsa_arctica.AAC.1